MIPRPTTYRLVDVDRGEAVLQALARELGGEVVELPPRRLTLLDTFDRRLTRCGGELEAQEEVGGVELRWAVGDGRAASRGTRRLRTDAVPAFARELPAGTFRRALEALTEPRRLLPLVEIERRGWSLRVRDSRQKTVLRLELHTDLAKDPASGRTATLPPALTALPLRGYEEVWKRAEKLLTHGLPNDLTTAVEVEDRGRMERALVALGRDLLPPGADLPALSPQQPAAEACREICLALLRRMELHEEGTRQDLDPEFLHDFRVAVRRTRSLLGEMKRVFDEPELAPLHRELRWLGEITGPTRDLDVHLLEMAAYRRDLPASTWAQLEPLEALLRTRQRQAHRRLRRALGSARYRRFKADWSGFLSRDDLLAAEAASNARVPILPLATRRIRRRYRRFLERGSSLEPSSPAAALHRLRIDGKKLRYLLELFSSLYPAAALRPAIKALKRLQDHLGSFHDLEVQQQVLRQLGTEALEKGRSGADTLLAVGHLVAQLERQQEEERQRFHRSFEEFASPRKTTLFEVLGAPPGEGDKA